MKRTRPEDFLELVERQKRGRLKVYIGFAAGVGKTYQMLEEAHALRRRSVDVVVGFVETHGRAETVALLDGLEIVPRRHIEYRGVAVDEMDLDAVLTRRPEVAIVDEVAHTNAPGSRHGRRWEDIVELLSAGINVICAFNVQHLKSLNGLIESATGVVVRETLPDTFLNHADQVVNIDLAPEDLLERLRAGKIYAPEKVPWALDNFFCASNLATLRELALREVAESVERSATNATGARAMASRSLERVLVYLHPGAPRATALLRRGSRLAGRLATDWYVVYVETPSDAPHLIDATAQRVLHRTIETARELGAEVVRLQRADPVAAVLDFGRSHRVGHLIVARLPEPWWRRWLGRDLVRRFLVDAADFDLHIVSEASLERLE